jgi:hypothetical protein
LWNRGIDAAGVTGIDSATSESFRIGGVDLQVWGEVIGCIELDDMTLDSARIVGVQRQAEGIDAVKAVSCAAEIGISLGEAAGLLPEEADAAGYLPLRSDLGGEFAEYGLVLEAVAINPRGGRRR